MTEPNPEGTDASAPSRPDWIAEPMSDTGSTEPSPASSTTPLSTSLVRFSSTPGLANRFTYHPPAIIPVGMRHAEARRIVLEAATALDNLVPPGRERATMLTKLEEAGFWANAGIARFDWSAEL